MDRTEFVRGYAQRSGFPDKWAALGFIETGGHVMVALPCACGDDGCVGWAMVGATSVLDHLVLNAPEGLRTAYREAVNAAEASPGDSE